MENELNKTIMVFNEIIYPENKSLLNILNSHDPKNDFGLFMGKHYVSCMLLMDVDQTRLKTTTDEIANLIEKELQFDGKIVHISGEDWTNKVNDIKDQIESGIPEALFITNFMKLSLLFAQFNLPDKEFYETSKEKIYSPKMQIVFCNIDNLKLGFIFISSKGTLLEEPTRTILMKNAEVLMKKRWKEKLTGKNNNTKKRDPIDSRLRHEVFKRDNYRCKECGRSNKESVLHVDHIIPVSQGGTDELSNLQTLCDICNLAKSNKAFKAP